MRMKSYWRSSFIGFAAAGLLLGAGGAAQAEMKLGFIDPEVILSNYREFQEADRKYREFEREMEREVTKMRNELQTLQQNYERQSLLLSEKRKQEEQQVIMKKQEELQRYVSEAADPQSGRLIQKNQELSAPVYRKVNMVIQRLAKDEGYDFVLNSPALAFAKEEHDLTERVMEELEKELQAEEQKKSESAR